MLKYSYKIAAAVFYIRIVSGQYQKGKSSDFLKAFVGLGNHYDDIWLKVFIYIFRRIAYIAGNAQYSVCSIQENRLMTSGMSRSGYY